MEITGYTKLIGIIGDPVSHSLSPRMQNAALAAIGLDICYVPLHVRSEALKDAVKGLVAMNFIGANVTIPHKISIIQFLDGLDETAAAVGAVNTIVNKDGKLIGHNTDGLGFIQALEEYIHPKYSTFPVLISGAGGAARSVGLALVEHGVPKINIINRTTSTAKEFKTVLLRKSPSLPVEIFTPDEDYSDAIAESKLVINATPLGMEGSLKKTPLKVDELTQEHVVCDLVYTKSQETPLLIAAREKRATIMGGLGMLLHQGAAAIQLWTNLEPPIDIMRQAIESQ